MLPTCNGTCAVAVNTVTHAYDGELHGETGISNINASRNRRGVASRMYPYALQKRPLSLQMFFDEVLVVFAERSRPPP